MIKLIRFIKYLILAILTIVGSFLAISLVVGFVFFRNAPDCSGDSEAANYVRSLSDSRLEKLYEDVKYFYHTDDDPYREYLVHDKAEVPLPPRKYGQDLRRS